MTEPSHPSECVDLSETSEAVLIVDDNSENDVTESINDESHYDGSVSHFRNYKAHSRWLRFGVPIYLIATFCLLLVSYIGSGIEALYILRASNGSIFEERRLLTASIFSSVKELWHTGSYALALLIVITSIAWPFLRLILSLLAWILPVYKSTRCRERGLEIVDALGKWQDQSYVLMIIVVAFRSTIPVGFGATVDVVILPLWGYYGFVVATLMSLAGTEAILHYQRRLMYRPKEMLPLRVEDGLTDVQEVDEKDSGEAPTARVASTVSEEPNVIEKNVLETAADSKDITVLARQTNSSRLFLVAMIVIGMVLHIYGSIIDIFQVSKTDNLGVTLYDDYSFISVGAQLPEATLYENGIRFIQAMYFALGLAFPIWNAILWVVLYLLPWTYQRQKTIFFLSEVAFSWGAMEVFVVSAIFSVLQIPKFGNGLVESGCTECYVVGSSIKPQFAVLAIASVWNVAVSIVYYRRAHRALYGHGGGSEGCICFCRWRNSAK